MKKRQKILLVAFHAVMLVLFLFMVLNGLQLRWRLGYVLFWLTATSGCAVYFIRGKKAVYNTISRIYAIGWVLLSIAGLIFTFLTFDAVYCETDKYIMKESSEIIGFDSAILYEKKGLLEVEKQRYKFVHPKSFTPLDSIGAIVIYGNFDNGETTEDGVAKLPLEDSLDKEKDKEYSLKHNIEYGE